VWQSGGRILSGDLLEATLDTPEVVAAVQFIHDLIYKHKVMDPELAQGATLRDLWSSGKVAFMLDGGWNIARYDTLFPDLVGKWDVAMVPAGKKRACFYGGQHLVMNRRSRHAELTWKFMVFATRPENQLRWTACGSPPSNLRTLELPAFKEKYPRFAIVDDVRRSGRNQPLAPYFASMWYTRVAGSVFERVWKDPDADVAQIVHDGALEAQDIVDEYWAVHDHASYLRQGDTKGAGRP